MKRSRRVRVLLDEQLPRQLAPLAIGHEVRTVQQQSWAGLKNGALLNAAEAAGFTVWSREIRACRFSRTSQSLVSTMDALALGGGQRQTVRERAPEARSL